MYAYSVVVLFSDDSEETKEFIASVFQPVQLSCERYAKLVLVSLVLSIDNNKV